MATEEELISQLEQQIAAEQAAIASMIPAAPTAEPLSWWQRGKLRASQEPMVPGIFGKSSIADMQASWDTPALRQIPEEALSIAGGIVGGGLATALAPATGGLSFAAPIIGSALGSYADVPVQMGLDYLLGETPTQSRLSQATTEAALGAGIEATLKSAGPAVRAVTPLARRGYSFLADFLGPQSAETAQALVGKELGGIAKTATTPAEAVLKQAADEKAALIAKGLPAEALTTADVTQLADVARLEKLSGSSSIANQNITFYEAAQKQIADLDNAAKSLTDVADPNPKRAGEAVRSLLENARETQRKAASDLFTDEVKAIPAPIGNIDERATDVFGKYFVGEKVDAPKAGVNSIYRKLLNLGKDETGDRVSNETTVGVLQSLRSQLLDQARGLPTGSADEAFANELADVIGKQIDEVPGTEALSAARDEWRQYKQRWFRGQDKQLSPLNKLLRKQSPEDIIKAVSGKGAKSVVADEYAKVLGGLEPNKLATEMADFVQQKTVGQKLDWIRAKRAAYVDSPIWPLIQQWEGILKKVEGKTIAADVPVLSTRNVNTQARSLIRALGGAEKEVYGTPAEAGTLSATRNIARSGASSAFGGDWLGAIIGAITPAQMNLVSKSTDLVGKALSEALSDPAKAFQFVEQAKAATAARQARQAGQDALIRSLTEPLTKYAPQAGAIARSTSLFDPGVISQQPTTVNPEALDQDIATIESAIEQEMANMRSEEANVGERAVPPEVQKQDISFLINDAAERYGVSPKLVNAVVKTESAGKSDAVSPKGAKGLMQLMPATAKSLGVDDPMDPAQNIEGGVKYLAQLIKKFGDEKLALAAYNWGEGNIRKQLARLAKRDKPQTLAAILKYGSLPQETEDYIRKISRLTEEA